jgi:Acyl-CoA carboxylase epsilon subunit
MATDLMADTGVVPGNPERRREPADLTGELRVVRGNPDDDETAAVLVLLRALARRPEEGRAAPPLPAGGWGPVTLPWPAARAS